METKAQLQERRRNTILSILKDYNSCNGQVLNAVMLTPYCIRVSKKIMKPGKIWEPFQKIPEENNSLFTGASIPILDIHFTSMRYHDLLNNERGSILGQWGNFIENKLNKLLKI